MPTYEYVCTECQNHWEEVQKISEPPVEVCPKCAKTSAKRQISGGNFILKGGGWYADLYSSSPKPKGEGKAGDSKSGSSDASTGSTAAKPDSGGSSGGDKSGSSSGSASSNAGASSSGSSGGAASAPKSPASK